MNRILIAVLLSLIIGLSPLQRPAASAQVETPPASTPEPADQPTNLSHSGTASQPRLVSMADGRMQVFWFDRFDGILTAVYNGQAWSAPKQAPLKVENINSMPDVFIASNGWINAFWLEPETGKNNGMILKYSSIEFGRSSWKNPQTLARSVLAFHITTSDSGDLLTYLQGQHLVGAPAGIYIRQAVSAHGGFGPPNWIYDDPYFRTLTADSAYVQTIVAPLAASSDQTAAGQPSNIIYLNWINPRSGGTVITRSADQGKTWSAVTQVEPPTRQDKFSRPRLLYSPETDNLVLLWNTGAGSDCAAYLQTTAANQAEIRLSPTSKITQPPLSACPKGDLVWSRPQGILWLWGQGTSQLGLMGWDDQAVQWLAPIELTYEGQEDSTQEPALLDDLHISLVGNQLMVVGHGTEIQDIWFVRTSLDKLAAPETEKSDWFEPQRVEIGNTFLNHLSLALDKTGQTHGVWSQRTLSGASGASLFYIQVNREKTSRSVEIVKPVEGNYDPQLDLAVEPQSADQDDLLHLVWSGGQDGGILYSYALTKEALAPIAWSTPVLISSLTPVTAAWPQLLVGPEHHLYVLYDIPLNERRGLYLAHSEDSGRKWSEPVQIFDAAKAGWQMIDHPTLAISPDGSLHAAWVNRPLPGMGLPAGIYYARSVDGGTTWSVPTPVAEAGYDWPTLVATQAQMNLIYLQTTSGSMFQRFFDQQETNDTSLPRWSVAFILDEPVQVLPNDPYRPFSISASGSSIYLTAVKQDTTDLFYSTWTGSQPGDARWSASEVISIPKESGMQVLSSMQGSMAILPASGILSVGLIQSVKASDSSTDQPGLELVMSGRSIPLEKSISIVSRAPATVGISGTLTAEQVLPTVVNGAAAQLNPGSSEGSAAATATASAGSTITTPNPIMTPTVNFSAVTEDRSLPVLPSVLGIILAAVTIVVAVMFRILRVRERS